MPANLSCASLTLSLLTFLAKQRNNGYDGTALRTMLEIVFGNGACALLIAFRHLLPDKAYSSADTFIVSKISGFAGCGITDTISKVTLQRRIDVAL